MKANANVCLVGDCVVLVPYQRQHVPLYHKWMQDPALLEATASEPLSLDDEYAMQITWANDDDKCTFIVLAREHHLDLPCDGSLPSDPTVGMVGDVNLFFNDADDPHVAEIEIMIAEPSARGKGMGLEAVRIMMQYGRSVLGVTKYVAKIGYDNVASIRMFQNKLGFQEVCRSECFREVTLELAQP